MRRYASQREGWLTVAVEDLRTGKELLYRADHAQRTASIVKLEILEALLARHRGRLPQQRTAAARRMIEDSSNEDAQRLWEVVGGARGLVRFGHRVGLTATRPAAADGPGYAWGLTLTTPIDQLRLLLLLTRKNRILGDWDRGFARRLMRHVTPDQSWGVTAGTPSSARIAIKNGWLALDLRLRLADQQHRMDPRPAPQLPDRRHDNR